MLRLDHGRQRPSLRDDGAAAVEFTLVLIPLLLLLFGIINFGFIFAAQINLNSAARDAARAGVVQPLGGTGLTCSEIAIMARNASDSIGSPAKETKVEVVAPNGSTVCTLPRDVTAIAANVTGSPNATPCTGSASLSGPQLKAVLTKVYNSPVQFVPPTTKTLTATGGFQCEYN